MAAESSVSCPESPGSPLWFAGIGILNSHGGKMNYRHLSFGVGFTALLSMGAVDKSR